MSHPEKVPALLAALFITAGLTACGGDAESAGDLDSTPYAEEAWEGDAMDADTAPPVTAPDAGTPPRAATPPSARPPAAAPPAAPAPAPPAAAPAPEPDPVPAPEPDPAMAGPVLPSGTQVTGVLETGLSTRTSQVGETFRARIGDAVRASDGTVILPAGSRLEGRVVESRESTSAEEQAVLLLEIRSLVVNGETFPIQATVLQTELASEARDSGQRTAATVATGAAAGAVVGRILGRDTRSTVAGAAAGAAAGAGIALTTRDGHASLAEGARITVRLDAPLVVARP
ncbi:MAG: hypothetical protein EA350_16580 [Gemmatimonadales bacterium]|nr:MAG: hypothetical protein EA350_16580 [Gemmatimonadales bacterium]